MVTVLFVLLSRLASRPGRMFASQTKCAQQPRGRSSIWTILCCLKHTSTVKGLRT